MNLPAFFGTPVANRDAPRPFRPLGLDGFSVLVVVVLTVVLILEFLAMATVFVSNALLTQTAGSRRRGSWKLIPCEVG